MNILMLDLDGVLVANSFILDEKEKYKDLDEIERYTHLSEYLPTFLGRCQTLFDKIYMNTTVDKKTTAKLLKEEIGVELDYWEWIDLKTEGYEELSQNNRIVHVEDGALPQEIEQMRELGVHYIEVKSYEGREDNELERVLEEIERIL